MIKLSEFLDESEASEEAKRMGLMSLGWGRWGKDNKVTHVTKNGKLVPADQKRGEPHPSHGAATRNVTRGRPAGEMPEPEYPINWKHGANKSSNRNSVDPWTRTMASVAGLTPDEWQKARATKTSPVGQPSTPEDPNAGIRATSLKKVPAGDYGSNEPNVNRMSSMMPKSNTETLDNFMSKSPELAPALLAKIKLVQAQKTLDSVPPDNEALYQRAEENFFMAQDAYEKAKHELSQSQRNPEQLNDPEDFDKNRNWTETP